MDAVVIGSIIALAGTFLVIGYLAYKIVKLVNSKDEQQ